LFVAAKLEEIYPPKLGDFAYITDGLYTKEHIKQQEALLLQVLEFDLLSTVTPISWLRVFCQKLACKRLNESCEETLDQNKNKNKNVKNANINANESSFNKSSVMNTSFNSVDSLLTASSFSQNTRSGDYSDSQITPLYPDSLYNEACGLLDLLIVDTKSLKYLPSTLAACSLVYTLKNFDHDFDKGFCQLKLETTNGSYQSSSDIENVYELIGTNYIDEQDNKVAECLEWMLPFAKCRSETINCQKLVNLNDNFDNLSLEKLPIPIMKCSIGPTIASYQQKHENQVDMLKRVRVWQHRHLKTKAKMRSNQNQLLYKQVTMLP